MRIACGIPKATNTHSEYVTIITFPLQQRLRQSASTLPYTYMACLVTTKEGHNVLPYPYHFNRQTITKYVPETYCSIDK